MEKLNKEYIELLSGESKASDKFWALEKRNRADKKDCGKAWDAVSRYVYGVTAMLMRSDGKEINRLL